MQWPKCEPSDYRSNMYLAPDPLLTQYEDVLEYALTIDGYQYASDKWNICNDTAALWDKVLSFNHGNRWLGSFEDLRCSLFVCQRRINWIESGAFDTNGRRIFFEIYRTICEMWKKRHEDESKIPSIMFNSVLIDAGYNLSNVRLLRHKDNRAEKGRTPFELWRDDRKQFELYQTTQTTGNRKKLSATYWASFVVPPNGETMFAGMYSVNYKGLLEKDTSMPHMEGVNKAGSCDEYEVRLENKLTDCIGRLIVDWGSAGRAWIQRADLQNKRVTEFRAEFKEPEFPGFLNFIEPLSKINALPKSWIMVLLSSKGIYLLTCPKTKEQYVGSATGENGFWQRWQDYVQNGHGGDIALKSRDVSDYQVSILEVAGTSLTTEEIIKMETRWKLKLQSREMGLNHN